MYILGPFKYTCYNSKNYEDECVRSYEGCMWFAMVDVKTASYITEFAWKLNRVWGLDE